MEPDIAAAIKLLGHEIELRYELTIEQMGTDGDHLHMLVSFHPKYSTGQFVRIFKSNIARELFKQFPALKKDLWGGEFWTDGYYAATVSTAGNWATVEAYVRNQGKTKPTQAHAQLTIW